MNPMIASRRIQTARMMSTLRLNLYCVPCWVILTLLLFTHLGDYLDRVSPSIVTYVLTCSLAPILAGMLTSVSPMKVNAVTATAAMAFASVVAASMVCLWLLLKIG